MQKRSYSNPLMGAGIQITGKNQLLNKSQGLQAFKSKREEQGKPQNMKSVLAEQRRKFLQQKADEEKAV